MGVTGIDLGSLNADPVPWLLENDTPAVKHRALRDLLDLPEDDAKVKRARAAAMRSHPIAAILDAQQPEGWWEKPGSGYGPKYSSTVWQVMFLDQLGADPRDRRVRKGCEYVLAHSQTKVGGFGASGSLHEDRPPPPSYAIHCLNGNLLRALIGFGWLDDERVKASIDWQSRSITGDGFEFYASGTSGPGFSCGANGKRPCAWGAVKALGALARIPARRRTADVREALAQGAEFLLSRDPAVADYPIPPYSNKPNSSWFKFGFPSAYVTDVLQNLEVLCELGYAKDPRLGPAIELMLSKQDANGRWKNEYAYNRKTSVDFEKQGAPSKWVTLRACRVLKAATA